ncbi:hypothetical protein [Butyrivibrio sp. VCB2006]|uniref:hypothetical protein n=1 Tax=Butyrivibrio sp. VCB2006 TaxID=1280679 RepID=UPI00040D8E80|nr:hypothetical protein [Butyrivibrio sp. VCB2006]
MKKKILNLLVIALFVAVVSGCLYAAATVVRRKESNNKYADFFTQAEKGNIDVLFMGSSHVINGVNPASLYKDYGFTSYNMGGHGSVMQATYWELIEALDYCTPKWVVVDAYMLEKNYQYLDVMNENTPQEDIDSSIDQLHLNMDCWPLNRLKLAAISDLIQDKEIRKEFLFDFMVYHDRWNELTREDYDVLAGKNGGEGLFGGELRYEVELKPSTSPDPAEGEVLAEHTVGQEYLMKIIDECQRRGIGVLVTYLPFCPTTEDKIAANSAGVTAGMYGVPYINMLDLDIIDVYTDLNDTGHLNALGAKKVTDFLGNWLLENADLTDHRGQAGYEYYDECAARYADNMKSGAVNADELYTQLEMLSFGDVGSVVYFNQGSNAFSDDGVKELVSKMSGTDKIVNTQGPYIMINDAGSGNVYEACGEEMLDGVATAMGSMVYQPVEQRFRLLYAKENEEVNYLYDDDHIWYDVQVITYDKNSGEVLSHKYYRSYGSKYRQD